MSVDEAAGPTAGASGAPVGLSWPVVAIAGAVGGAVGGAGGRAVGGGVAPQLPSRLGASRLPRPGRALGVDLAALVAGSAPVFVPTEVPAAPREADLDIPDVAAIGERASVGAFRRAARSDNTLAAYRADWGRFTAWCARYGVSALPAAPAVVAAYAAEAANTTATVGRSAPWRYSPATLARWLATINKAHDLAGLVAPGRDPAVTETQAGIRRSRATPPKRKTPLLLADLEHLVAAIAVTGWPAAPAACGTGACF